MAHYLMPMYMMASLKGLCILLESALLVSGRLHSNNANSKVVFCMQQQHLLVCCPFVSLSCLFASAQGKGAGFP